MNKIQETGWSNILRWSGTILLVGWLLTLIDVHEALSIFVAAEIDLMAVVLVVLVAIWLVMAWRWLYVLRPPGVNAGFIDGFRITMVSIALSRVIPGGRDAVNAYLTAQGVSDIIAAAAGLDPHGSKTGTTEVPASLVSEQSASGSRVDFDDLPPRLKLKRRSDAIQIAKLAAESGSGSVDELLVAEATFAARNKMALTPLEVRRRAGIGQLSCPPSAMLRVFANSVAAKLGWSADITQSEILAVQADLWYSMAGSPQVTGKWHV